MLLDPNWLTRGNFYDLTAKAPPIMRAIQEELCRQLRMPTSQLRIAHFPPRETYKHCYWWREGKTGFVEAQFFAEVSRSYPVLSLGVSIEKGRENVVQTGSKPLMDRRTWDWGRLVDHLPAMLDGDLRHAAGIPPAPIHVRVRSRGLVPAGLNAWVTRAFSLIEGDWFQRHHGPVEATDVLEYIRDIDKHSDTAAIMHFARDVFPSDIKKMSATDAANILMRFDPLRQRFRQGPMVSKPAVVRRRR